MYEYVCMRFDFLEVRSLFLFSTGALRCDFWNLIFAIYFVKKHYHRAINNASTKTVPIIITT